MSIDRILHDALTDVAASARPEPNVADLIGRFDRRARQRRTRRIAVSAASIVATVAFVLAATGSSRANNAVQVDRPQSRHQSTTTLEKHAAGGSRRSDVRSSTTTTASPRARSVTVGTSPRKQSPNVELPVGPQLPSDPGVTPTTLERANPDPTTTTTTTTVEPSGQYTAWSTGLRTPTTFEAMNTDPNSCDAHLGGSGAAAGAPDGNPWAYYSGVVAGCSASQPHIAVAEFPYLHCANVSAISSFDIVIVSTSGQTATTITQFKVITAIDDGPNVTSVQLSEAIPAGAHTSTFGPYNGGIKDLMVDATSSVVTLLAFDPGITMAIDAIGIRYHGDLSGCTHA